MPPLLLPSLAQRARSSVVRIVCTPKEGDVMVGTGFFIAPRQILTCAHVLLCNANLLSLLDEGAKEAQDTAPYEAALGTRLEGITVSAQHADGKRYPIKHIRFNGALDVGMLDVKEEGSPLATEQEQPAIGQDIFTVGFPYTIHTPDQEFPYAANRGIVTSHTRVQIGGYRRRQFLQLNCPALGGSSGSPVFSTDGYVIAMLTAISHGEAMISRPSKKARMGRRSSKIPSTSPCPTPSQRP